MPNGTNDRSGCRQAGPLQAGPGRPHPTDCLVTERVKRIADLLITASQVTAAAGRRCGPPPVANRRGDVCRARPRGPAARVAPVAAVRAGRRREVHQAEHAPRQARLPARRVRKRVVRRDRRAPRDADPRHRLRRVREQPRAQQVRRQQRAGEALVAAHCHRARRAAADVDEAADGLEGEAVGGAAAAEVRQGAHGEAVPLVRGEALVVIGLVEQHDDGGAEEGEEIGVELVAEISAAVDVDP